GQWIWAMQQGYGSSRTSNGFLACILDHHLELLARMESDDAACRNRNFLAGFRIASRSLRLVAQLEVAKAGQLDRFAALQRIADFVEEGFDHVLGFALVQADLFEQQFCQFG